MNTHKTHAEIKNLSNNLIGEDKKYAVKIMMVMSRYRKSMVWNIEKPESDVAEEIYQIAKRWALGW